MCSSRSAEITLQKKSQGIHNWIGSSNSSRNQPGTEGREKQNWLASCVAGDEGKEADGGEQERNEAGETGEAARESKGEQITPPTIALSVVAFVSCTASLPHALRDTPCVNATKLSSSVVQALSPTCV